MKKKALYLLFLINLASCSIPQIQDLRSLPPNAQFQVDGAPSCIYSQGVEHVSSYIGASEPSFTWFISENKQYAWFRQPLTLVELQSLGGSATEVRRKQTSSARVLGQGDQLLEFIKDHPCK